MSDTQIPPANPFPNDTLADALARHQMEFTPEQVKQIDHYRQLLWDWNEKINLTRHTDYEKFVARDVLDSWQLSKLLHAGEDVLDVGTGGGVPGILVAIMRPDLQVQLCDTVGKKVKVVEDIVKQMKLNVEVHHSSAQDILEDNRFTAVVTRAVGSISKMCDWFEPHWVMMGRLLTIKGPKWTEERGEARHLGSFKSLQLRVAVSYPMPGTDSESVILKIWPKGAPEK